MFEHMDIVSRIAKYSRVIFFLMLAIILIKCDDAVTIPEGAFEEQEVDISGAWTISTVIRNGEDISDKFDFSGFSLSLNMNGEMPTTYEIQNGGAPFPVISSGSWSFDDNVYPTLMTLTNTEGASQISFDRAPISGNTTMEIEFQLGCSENSYKYTLSKN